MKPFIRLGMLCMLPMLFSGIAVAQEIIEIDVPFNVNEPPKAMPGAVRVAAGASVQMALTGTEQVRVFFKDERTPIVNRASGRLVFEFVLNRGMAHVLEVVDECDEHGCEYRYGVRDLNDPRRPVLDPIIIIER